MVTWKTTSTKNKEWTNNGSTISRNDEFMS